MKFNNTGEHYIYNKIYNKNPRVTVLVLNYNGISFLEACISSIFNQTYKNIEILVVDNNSTDKSVSYIKKHNGIRLIENNTNYGYAKANNIGVRNASGELVLILNNDTELFPDMVEQLVNAYEPNCILAPAQILMNNKAIDQIGLSGVGVDLFGIPFLEENTQNTKMFYADGAGIFVSKEDFLALGGFDENLFMFQEDIDFSWRAQILGYSIKRCRDAKFYHYSGGVAGGGMHIDDTNKYATSYFRRYLNEKNTVRNIIKNYALPLCIFVLVVYLTLSLFEMFVLTILGRFKVISCYMHAYKWNLMNLSDTLKYRKSVQNRRVVSDLVLLKRMYFSYSKLTSLIRLGIPEFK